MANRFPTVRPTAAEQAAQRWHREYHQRGVKGWTACYACKKANPHYAAASRNEHADVWARIRASVSASRVHPKHDDNDDAR